MSTRTRRPLEDCAYRRALSASEGAYSLTLTNGRALLYRKPKTKPPFWAARITTLEGSYRRKRLGLADDSDQESHVGLSFEQAKDQAITWFAEPEQRRIGIEDRPAGPCRRLTVCPTGPDYSVAHLMTDYVDWASWFRSKSYQKHTFLSANKYILPALGNRCVSALRSQELRRWVNWVEERLAAGPKSLLRCSAATPAQREQQRRAHKSTARRCFSVLCSALELAYGEEKIGDARVWRRLLHSEPAKRGRRFGLSLEQCTEAVFGAETNLRALIKAALYTGARFSELIDIRAQDVQIRRRAIRVRPKKNRRDRFVTLSPETHRFFLDLRACCAHEQEVLLKSQTGGPWSYEMARMGLKRIVDQRGLPPKTTFHILRHTHASQLIGAGADPISVARQLGHANVKTVLNSYMHCTDELVQTKLLKDLTLAGVDGFAYVPIE